MSKEAGLQHVHNLTKYATPFAFSLLVTGVILFTIKEPPTFRYKVPQAQQFNASNKIESAKYFMELDVIVQFPLLTDPQFNSTRFSKYDFLQKKQRMEEYITSLFRTLEHRYVSHVHVLYDQLRLRKYVTDHLKSELMNKITFHLVDDPKRASTAFEYAYSKLQCRLVMLCQADVYPGDGLDLVKRDVMIKKKLMYALTRHSQLENTCNMRRDKKSNTCSDKGYIGSHDAYIFVPIGTFFVNASKALDHPSNNLGIDNLIIWTFKTILHYNVINPCKVIFIFHFHCSGVRNEDRKHRVNTRKTFGRAKPTDKLV